VKILMILLPGLLAFSPVLPARAGAQSVSPDGAAMPQAGNHAPMYVNDDDPPPPDDQPPPPGRGGRPNAEQRRHFEEFRLMKLIEVLDLTEQQKAPFTTAYQEMRKLQRVLDDNKREALEKLSLAVKADKPDRTEINGLIDKIVGYELDKRNLNRQFLDKARQLLTPEQTGRLVLFAERFDSTVFQRLAAMRQGMMGRGQGRGMRQHADSTRDSK
jgi:Spy/CpxP family protein refolding chaperone